MTTRDYPTAHLSWLVRFLPDAERERAIAAARERIGKLRAPVFPITLVVDEPPFEVQP